MPKKHNKRSPQQSQQNKIMKKNSPSKLRITILTSLIIATLIISYFFLFPSKKDPQTSTPQSNATPTSDKNPTTDNNSQTEQEKAEQENLLKQKRQQQSEDAIREKTKDLKEPPIVQHVPQLSSSKNKLVKVIDKEGCTTHQEYNPSKKLIKTTINNKRDGTKHIVHDHNPKTGKITKTTIYNSDGSIKTTHNIK